MINSIYTQWQLDAANAFTFTFTLKASSLCPEWLTVSTFVTRKKPQHITVDKVRKKNRKHSSPRLGILVAFYHQSSFTRQSSSKSFSMKVIMWTRVWGGDDFSLKWSLWEKVFPSAFKFSLYTSIGHKKQHRREDYRIVTGWQTVTLSAHQLVQVSNCTASSHKVVVPVEHCLTPDASSVSGSQTAGCWSFYWAESLSADRCSVLSFVKKINK